MSSLLNPALVSVFGIAQGCEQTKHIKNFPREDSEKKKNNKQGEEEEESNVVKEGRKKRRRFGLLFSMGVTNQKQNVFHASVRMRSGPNPAYQSTFSMISYTTIQGHFKFNLYESNPASVRYDSLSR
ncbi:unnamed protein product [Brassica napus]|uniref:(rape) hypothetical protein n=1 Tax=Brassica napus TaxID=3708 RepID=A0A816ZLY9_BRANA|nr:unnamed protein product [Brassica napus]